MASLIFVVTILLLNISIYRYVNARIREKIIALKFIIGMVLAAASLLTTGIIEIERQHQNSSTLPNFELALNDPNVNPF